MGLFDSFRQQKKEPAPDYLPPATAKAKQKTDPKAAEELVTKAGILLQRGMSSGSKDLLKEALTNTDKALEQDPDCYNAVQLKFAVLVMLDKDDRTNLEMAVACCDRALALKKDKFGMWFNKAGVLEQLGRYEEAIAAYDKALAGDPSDTSFGFLGAMVAKGRTLEKTGRDDEALRVYERVAANTRSYGEAQKGKAAIMERRGNREAALQAYRAAAGMFRKGMEYKDAVECLDRILVLDPQDTEALYQKGDALVNDHAKTSPPALLDNADACFDRVLAKEPRHVASLTGKGRCSLARNHMDKSLGFFNQALSISPTDYDALMEKGEALIQLMRYDEALGVFDRTGSVHPGSPQPWYKKAVISVQQGNYTQALSDIDQAIKRAERIFPFWEMRAQLLRKLGRTAAAEESEAMAKRYDPRQWVAK